MKKLNKVAMLFASAALATAAGAQTVDNWKNGSNELVWKNGTNEYCWRDANWTPATAFPGCDGAIAPVVAPRAAPAPVAAAPAPVVVAPAPAQLLRQQPWLPKSPTLPMLSLILTNQFSSQKAKPNWTIWLVKSRTSTSKSSLLLVIPMQWVAMLTTRSCRFAVQKLSRLTWCQKASRKTAFTPKAKARNSQLLITRPPKAALKTAASRSKLLAHAPTSNPSRLLEKTALRRGFFMPER